MAKKKSGARRTEGKFPLWKMGLILLVAAALGSVVSPLVMGLLPPPADRNEALGRAFGGGLVTFLVAATGVVLIVIHFVRQRR